VAAAETVETVAEVTGALPPEAAGAVEEEELLALAPEEAAAGWAPVGSQPGWRTGRKLSQELWFRSRAALGVRPPPKEVFGREGALDAEPALVPPCAEAALLAANGAVRPVRGARAAFTTGTPAFAAAATAARGSTAGLRFMEAAVVASSVAGRMKA